MVNNSFWANVLRQRYPTCNHFPLGYYPQPSHAERFNRNLRSALNGYHAEQQNCWDQNLKWLQLAFNMALHESHKVPFEVMFWFSPTLPLANLWKIEDLLPNTPDIRTADRWKEARKNLLRAHERVPVRYNQGWTPNPVSYTHLDVYKRQVYVCRECFHYLEI